MNSAKWMGGTEEEYETQHFGFGAQRFKMAVRQMIEEKIKTGINNMESCLQEALGLNETDKDTLTRSCNKLIGLYCERARPSLEVIDKEIEKFLKIPSNVLLPDDEAQIEQTSESDLEKLKEELSEVRKRVVRGNLMEALLRAEEEELLAMENVCVTAKKDMKELDLLYNSTAVDDSLKSIQYEEQLLSTQASFIVKDTSNILD